MTHGAATSLATLLITTTSLTACAAAGNNKTPVRVDREKPLVRVAGSAITQGTFAHWIAIMAPQHVASAPPHYTACVAHRKLLAPHAHQAQLEQECRSQYDALRQQVVEFLISESWLIGEATKEGLGVSAQEVTQQLAQKRNAYGGEAQFQESLRAIDHTPADLELEIRAELAEEKIRKRLRERLQKITATQIADYYRRHISRYRIPERRYFDIVENLGSAAAARKLSKEFAQHTASLSNDSLHESLARGAQGSPAEHKIIYNAIFAAKLGVLTQPILINHRYFLVKVKRITPPRLQPLSEVQAAIRRKLTSAQYRRALAAFVKAWRARWIASTSCSPGYVVQRCSQYTGPRTFEEPLSLH